MTVRVGIMQGRLSPPAGGRIQAFPGGTWREEFSLAARAGLHCIEWVYEAETEADNPLNREAGAAQVRRFAATTGVAVRSVCADYYMTEHLVAADGLPQTAVIAHLRGLLGRVGALGVRYVVLPFVDASSLRSPAQLDGLVAVLDEVLPVAERVRVELHLETDLAPGVLGDVLARVEHPRLRANYDIGNSASLGHDPREEFAAIGRRLGSVHVKDRIREGGTVPLGTGAADFPCCFRLIRDAGFDGPFILQAARVDGVSEVDLAVTNRRFVEDQVAAVDA